MTKSVFLLAPMALLAACGGDADGGVEPGQWNFTVTPSSVEAPNAPEAMQEMIQAQIGQQPPQSTSECFSAAEARNFAGSLNRFSGNDDCEITNSEVGNGTLLIEGTCNIPGADEPAPLTMRGTYDRTQLDAEVVLEMNAEPLGEMTVTADLEGRHEGEC